MDPEARNNLLLSSQKRVCLHGARQTSQIFADRISRLVSKLRALNVHAEFVDGPCQLPLEPGDSASLRAWYEGDGVKSALAAIDKHWANGGFDGVLGFSQGALMAVYVATNPQRYSGCRFAIIASSPGAPLPQLAAVKSTVPALHMMSAADKAVPRHESLKVMNALFAHGTAVLYDHPKGHALPCRAEDVQAVVDFLTQRVLRADQGAPPKPAGPERRIAPDGGGYTKQEFKAYFGGLDEWQAAHEIAPEIEPEIARA